MPDTDTQQIADASGNEQPAKEPVEAYDSKHGTYADAVEKVPQEQLLQEQTMPKAPDPSPFKLGPMAGGGGE